MLATDSQRENALATLEWLDWFNDRRLFEPIATVHTAEAEARYHVQLEELPMAA